MTPHPTYLAFDLGASSGRAVVGTLVGEGDAARMEMREVHRFRTPLVEEHGHLRWDHAALWGEVRAGLARALDVAPALRAVSVDSWAVDYVPLGADGKPLRKPYAYRDPRVRGRLDAFAERERLAGFDPAYMIDQSHNIKDPVEDMLQTVDQLQLAYAKAQLVDHAALDGYQESGDVVMAERTLKAAF